MFKINSIWWFIGALFICYGIIILLTGIVYCFNPPTNISLVNYHASIWWGLIMLIAGLGFLVLNKGASEDGR